MRDLGFLFYYYPVRCGIRLFGRPFLRLAESVLGAVSCRLQRRDRSITIQNMQSMFGLPPQEAGQLADRFLKNRIRQRLFDLRGDIGGPVPDPVLVGKHHLDRALSKGRGVALVTIHTPAKREARASLTAAGITYTPLIAGRNRQFVMHGRLLNRWISPKLLSLQIGEWNQFVDRDDPSAALQLASILRDGGIVLFGIDTLGSKSEWAPFHHGETPINFAVLDIARLTGCSIVPMWMSFHDNERCQIEFREALPIELTTRNPEAIAAARALLAKAAEEQLSAHPDQWDAWNQPNRWRTTKNTNA